MPVRSSPKGSEGAATPGAGYSTQSAEGLFQAAKRPPLLPHPEKCGNNGFIAIQNRYGSKVGNTLKILLKAGSPKRRPVRAEFWQNPRPGFALEARETDCRLEPSSTKIWLAQTGILVGLPGHAVFPPARANLDSRNRGQATQKERFWNDQMQRPETRF